MDNKLTYDLTYKDVVEILKIAEIPAMANLRLELEGLKLEVVFRESAAGDKPQVMDDAAATVAVSGVALKEGLKQDPLTITSGKNEVREQTGGVSVRAPLAGTFFRAPAPGAASFVEVGQTVRAGDKLGLIELMKLFTPVNSPCSGVVIEICANNQELVDCDKVLVVIEEEK